MNIRSAHLIKMRCRQIIGIGIHIGGSWIRKHCRITLSWYDKHGHRKIQTETSTLEYHVPVNRTDDDDNSSALLLMVVRAYRIEFIYKYISLVMRQR